MNNIPFFINPFYMNNYPNLIESLEARITNLEKEITNLKNIINNLENNNKDTYTSNYKINTYNMM